MMRKIKWALLFVLVALIIVSMASAQGGMWSENPWNWLWFKGVQVQWIPLVVGP